MAIYPGGKNGSGTYQQIINQIPPFNFYFEGFAGSAAIHRLLKWSGTAILCDLSSYQLASLKPSLPAAAIAVKFDTISNIDFIVNLLNFLCDAGREVFAYFDPPYLFDVRSRQKKMYEFELDSASHIALLTGLISARFNCMLSCYDSSLYNSMLAGWRKHQFYSTTRRGSKLETLYMNYAIPAELQSYEFIGNNFREREQFTRIRKNFLSKLNAMPDHLRNSIISEIKSYSNKKAVKS